MLWGGWSLKTFVPLTDCWSESHVDVGWGICLGPSGRLELCSPLMVSNLLKPLEPCTGVTMGWMMGEWSPTPAWGSTQLYNHQFVRMESAWPGEDWRAVGDKVMLDVVRQGVDETCRPAEDRILLHCLGYHLDWRSGKMYLRWLRLGERSDDRQRCWVDQSQVGQVHWQVEVSQEICSQDRFLDIRHHEDLIKFPP